MKPLRVAICTKKDIHGLTTVNRLIPHLRNCDVKVFCSIKTRPAETKVPELILLKALERDISIEYLSNIVTDTDRGNLDPRNWCVLENLKSPGGKDDLLGFRPDVIISIRFSLIFCREIIQSFPGGIINVHPGELPHYKGLFVPFWQVQNEEPRFGSTLHLIDEGIDTGNILGLRHLERVPNRSLIWHINGIYSAAIPLIVDYLDEVKLGSLPVGIPQTEGRYHAFPTPADFQEFREKGNALATPGDFAECLISAYSS